MIRIITDINAIDRHQWEVLLQERTASWFQTPEAYAFYAQLPDQFTPFVFAAEDDGRLVGVIVGYITRNPRPIKHYFTRRASIIAGPLLAEDISTDALDALLLAMQKGLARKAIYVETRNFNDYSKWHAIFTRRGYVYQERLNFHVDTTTVAGVDAHLSKSRKRNIQVTIRNGATAVLRPTIEQVREYYTILLHLYRTRVKTPLAPLSFFEKLFEQPNAHFLLVEYQGKIVGGIVCVCLPGRAVYEWYVCGADGLFDNIYPSSYATYLGIRYAAENGCSRFDMMGAGTPQDPYGVRDFKARFGGELVQHGRYRCTCNKLLYAIGVIGVMILRRKTVGNTPHF